MFILTKQIMKLMMVIIGFSWLAACQSNNVTLTTTPTPPSNPLQGKATLYGRLSVQDTGKPLANFAVRLATADLAVDGWFDNPAAPPGSTNTDAEGYFAIRDVAPGTYVIVVGIPEGNDYGIVRSQPDTARVFDLKADQLINLGDLVVSLK